MVEPLVKDPPDVLRDLPSLITTVMVEPLVKDQPGMIGTSPHNYYSNGGAPGQRSP